MSKISEGREKYRSFKTVLTQTSLIYISNISPLNIKKKHFRSDEFLQIILMPFIRKYFNLWM